MSLLDLPRPPSSGKRKCAPITKTPAERLAEVEAKLHNAKARHARAAAALLKTRKALDKARDDAEAQARAERAAWDRVANIMGDFERIRRICEEGVQS